MPENLDFVAILQMGVWGLGFLLAGFSYYLLSQEQKQEQPRSTILKSIYVFMFFSILLCCLGMVSQILDKKIVNTSFVEKDIRTEVTIFYSRLVAQLGENDIQLRSDGTFTLKEKAISGNTSRFGGEARIPFKWNGRIENDNKELLGFKTDKLLTISDEKGVYFLALDRGSYKGFYFGESGDSKYRFVMSPIILSTSNDDLSEEDIKTTWPILSETPQFFRTIDKIFTAQE